MLTLYFEKHIHQSEVVSVLTAVADSAIQPMPGGTSVVGTSGVEVCRPRPDCRAQTLAPTHPGHVTSHGPSSQ